MGKVRESFRQPYDDETLPYDGKQWDATSFGGYSADGYWGEDGKWHTNSTNREDYVNRYRGLGEAAAQREAYQLNYNKAQQDYERQLWSRGGQMEAAGQLQNAAEGNASSRAEIMAQGGLDTATRGQLMAGGGAKGLAGAAQAQQQASMQTQTGQLAAVDQATGQRAAELDQARGTFMQGAGAIRAMDYGAQKSAQRRAASQMESELAQRERNQKAQEAYEKMAFGVNKAEMNADIARRTQYAKNDAIRQQGADAKADANQQLVGATVGGAGTLGAGALGGAGGGSPPAASPAPADPDRERRDWETSNSDVRGKSGIRILSDDRTKLASAWDKGYEAAVANVEKASRKDAPSLAQAAKLREGQKKDDETTLASSAARDIKARAWDEGHQDAKALYTAKGRNEAMSAMYEAEKRKAQIEGHRLVPNNAGGRLSGIAARFRHPGTPEYEQADATRAAIDNAQAAVVRSGQRMQSLDPVATRSESMQDAAAEQGMPVYSAMSSDVRGKEHSALLAEADRQIANYRGAASKPASGMSPKEQAMMDEADRQIDNYKADDRPAAVDQKGDAMMRDADEQIRNMKEREKAPPAVGDALARGLKPYEYEYKPGFREQEGQKPGEKNVGPMAQNMASNPITGSAVGQGEDGLLYIDMPKATKLSLGGIGYLAQQQREQEERLKRLEKGGR